jgi:hypothetical protein
MGFVVKINMVVLKCKSGVKESKVLGIGQLVWVYWFFKTSNILLVQQFTLLKSFT